MSQIFVLYDGHRTKVSVTPSMNMRTILEQACDSFKLNPNYAKIFHRNSDIDLSLPFRFTGISNNAVLELKYNSKFGKDIGAIRVCVQMPQGERKQGTFAGAILLTDMLQELGIDTQRVHSMTFMRREVLKSNFDTTTLQALGFSSGSVMFRLVEGSSNLLEQQPNTLQLATPSFPPPPSTPSSIAVPMELDAYETSGSSKKMVHFETEEKRTESFENPTSMPSMYDSIQTLRNNSFDAASKESIILLMKVICNVLSKPNESKVRSIRLNNPKFQATIGNVKGGVDFLIACGFLHIDGSLVLEKSKEDTATLNEALQILRNEADDLSIEASARPQIKTPIQPDPNFDPYQAQITRTQFQPRGSTNTDRMVAEFKDKKQQLLDFKVPERKGIVLFPKLAEIIQDDQVDESGDKQLILKSLRQKKEVRKKSENFRTLAMREFDELRRQKVYTTTLLRIQFSDRIILQARFHPNEKVKDVEYYLRNSCLRQEWKSCPFHLFICPPMKILNSDHTLQEAEIVPAALIHLSFDKEDKQLLDGGKECLIPSLIFGDDSKTSDNAISYPQSQPLAPSSAVTHDSSSVSQAKSVKPKWLKLN